MQWTVNSYSRAESDGWKKWVDKNTVTPGFQGSYVEKNNSTNEEFSAMVENWITIKDRPEIVNAEFEENIKNLEK